jgi:hypothetical protein
MVNLLLARPTDLAVEEPSFPINNAEPSGSGLEL